MCGNNFMICVLVFSLMTYANGFTPNSICVDKNGNVVDCPESANGFNFGAGYIYQAPTSGLAKTRSMSYSSAYSPETFDVIEESVDNYNKIGEKPGTHWISCVLQRNIEYTTVSVPKTVWKTKTTWTFNGSTTITYPVTYTENTQMMTGVNYSFVWKTRASVSNVNVFDPVTGTDGYNCLTSLSNIPALKKIINILPKGAVYKSENCLASAYVILGKGDNDPWNKPVIVSDGFDPRERIAIQELLENVDNSVAPNAYQFIQTIIEKGNDVVFVDFKDGGKDMVENARALFRVVETVCEKSKSNNIMVGGYSMGGLVARLALLLGEKNNRLCMSKISRNLSIDSPHLGAQINTDMQNKIMTICNSTLTDPVNYLSYEKVASVAYDLKSDAARQLLFSHAISGSTDHDEFFSFLKSIGDYPSKVKRYAIADASWIWPYPGAALSGVKAATVTGTDFYMKNDDLFPGSYIDLWASGTEPLPLAQGTGVGFAFANIGLALKNYFNLKTYTPVSTVFGDTRYKPTFIPLYSALGISKENFLQITEPKTQADLDNIASAYSPFNKLYLVNFNSRHKHIDFDTDLADKVLMSLKTPDITAILQLLLD